MSNEQNGSGERRHPTVFPGFSAIAGRRQELTTSLVARRTAQGLSQTEVAARMGTSQSAVARLESGQADVLLSTLDRYAQAIGGQLDWRLTAGGSPAPAGAAGSWPPVGTESGPPAGAGAGAAGSSPPTGAGAGAAGSWPPGGPGPQGPDPWSPRVPGPDRPRIPGPAGTSSSWPEWVRGELFGRRVVLLRGDLDDELAGQVAAELMMLDASGDGPVTLHVDSTGGSLLAAFTVIDTMDLLGVPVEVVCVGRAQGAAVGVVAAGATRYASPHAQLRLSEPSSSVSGSARDIEAWAEQHQRQLARYVQRIADATGRPGEHIEADLATGRWLSADEAVAYGLVDGLWRGEPGPSRRRPIGFGP